MLPKSRKKHSMDYQSRGSWLAERLLNERGWESMDPLRSVEEIDDFIKELREER